jgi:FAD:protein FMN transferase
LLLLALLPSWGAGVRSADRRFEFMKQLMGVRARIVLYAPDFETARIEAEVGFARIEALEAMMSDYRPESELSMLSQSAVRRDVRVSAELLQVLATAQDLARETDGAFDITVGPLSRLWRRCRAESRLPTEEELRAAREASGWEKLSVDRERGTVRLSREGMSLDLGGIAKGFAVEEALAALRARGRTRVLVALAGDIAVGDPPPDEQGWQIEVGPRMDGPRFITVKACFVSTSGSTEQFVEIEGVRYSHIIDPRTGLGSTAGTMATVVAARGETADALATSLCIPGIDARGLLEKTPGVSAAIWDGGRRAPEIIGGFPAIDRSYRRPRADP